MLGDIPRSAANPTGPSISPIGSVKFLLALLLFCMALAPGTLRT